MTDTKMAPQVDIAALASLARIDVTPKEMLTLQKEIPAILAFVETIQEASIDAPQALSGLHNVKREDEHPRASGTYTESILSGSPARKGSYVVVKQVISRKK